MIPANPFDARQLVAYLKDNPSEAKSLIWTLNLELTPIYAIEPCGPFGDVVYKSLVELLEHQNKAPSDPDYVNRRAFRAYSPATPSSSSPARSCRHSPSTPSEGSMVGPLTS